MLGSLVETVWYVHSSRKALRPFMNHLISLYFTSFLLRETEVIYVLFFLRMTYLVS